MCVRPLIALALTAAALAGCGPDYSPDTYASNAAQQANPTTQGVVIGVRAVTVTTSGTVGAAAGAAAGGAVGADAPVASTLSSIGGALVGGIVGGATEQVAAEKTAFEYIVRKSNGELVSVTQKDAKPLAVGQKVLVIAGPQARIVADYTVDPASLKAPTAGGDHPGAIAAVSPTPASAATAPPSHSASPPAVPPAVPQVAHFDPAGPPIPLVPPPAPAPAVAPEILSPIAPP